MSSIRQWVQEEMGAHMPFLMCFNANQVLCTKILHGYAPLHDPSTTSESKPKKEEENHVNRVHFGR